MRIAAALGILALALSALPAQPPQGAGRFSYLDNGEVKVGVDLAVGGAITEYKLSGRDENLLDSREWGRQLYATYYGGPVPYATNGKRPPDKWRNMGWAAAQVGSGFRQPAAVSEHENDGKSIRVKTRPMQWALDHEPADCTIETRITLDGRALRVKHRLENHRSDRTLYPAREQLAPAVFVTPRLRRLMAYTGAKPFTNETVASLVRGSARSNDDPWLNFTATESCVALVDDEEWGVGLCVPGRTRFRGGSDGQQGSLLAAPRTETLDREIVFEYEYAVIAGPLESIRAYAAKLAPKPGAMSWTFSRDRQGWYALGAHENQYPFDSDWKLLPTGPRHQQINSPDIFWTAEQAPMLTLEAAFQTQQPQVTVWWLPLDATEFTRERSLTLTVQPDGKVREYTFDLASVGSYRGGMTRLRIDTTPLGRPGDQVRIRRITLGPRPQ